MALPTGLGQGLAFNIDYSDRINQLHRNESLDLRARNDAEARAALMAQDASFQNAMNIHDREIISTNARDTIKKMGEYRRNNPDMMYNPDKLIQFNLMKKNLTDNPDLIRGVASDNAYKEYTKDLQEVAKNPQMHDVGAYDEIKNQWSNYLQYGNQNGLEASQKEGKKAFLYTKPQDFVDLPATLQKYGDGIKNYNVVKVHGGNLGEAYTEPRADEVEAIKKSVYQQHGRQIQVQAQALGLDTPEKIDKWITDGISSGFKKNYWLGDANAFWERNYKTQQLNLEKEKMENKKPGPSYTPADWLFDPRNRAGTLSVDTQIRPIWNDKPQMTLVGVDGTKVDLTGFDLKYSGRYVKNKDNTTFLLGGVRMPVQIAKQKGILKNDDSDLTIADINSPFLGQAHLEWDVDKEGKKYQYVNIDYHLPINANDVNARQQFNRLADVDKLVPASQDPYGGGKKSAPPGSGYDTVGNVFSAEGKLLGKMSEFQ